MPAFASRSGSAGPRFRSCLLGLVAAGLALAGAHAEQRRCARAQTVAGEGKALPEIAAKVEAGQPIRVVALGSSSTEGTPDMPREAIYVSVFARELAREVLAPVELINKGKGGETIPHMVERLERDVFANKPDLVIWQLGTNDVLQMDGIQGSVDLMRTTLARFRAMRIPVVLVDLQVAPMVDRDRDTETMQDAIREAAKAEGVLHFRRQAMMRRLIELREASEQDLVEKDGLHMSSFAHLCTGALLAGQIAKSSFTREVPFATVAARR